MRYKRPDSRLLLIWDGATYHRGEEFRKMTRAHPTESSLRAIDQSAFSSLLESSSIEDFSQIVS